MSSSTAEVVLNLTARGFSVGGAAMPIGTVIPFPSYKSRGWCFVTDDGSFIGAVSGTAHLDEDGEPNPNFGLSPELVLGAVHKAATEYLRARGIDRVPEVARWSGARRGPDGELDRDPNGQLIFNDRVLDRLDPKRELRDTTLPA